MTISDSEFAASYAISLAKKRQRTEVIPDDLLLGALHAISLFGIVRLGPWTIDIEALGVDWICRPDASAKVGYSAEAVERFDQAARIARSAGSSTIRASHLLAAFAGDDTGLMGELKRAHGITSAGWRAALAEFGTANAPAPETVSELAPLPVAAPVPTLRDYLTPEEAAEELGVHVQTLRAYVRSGKLPAMRIAGERAIRIRRIDLATILEPLGPGRAAPDTIT
jgi:excisionase family DNA binding protein